MKAYEGVDVYIHIFLTSALAEGEWSASRPWYPLDGILGGPQSRSGRRGKENSVSYRDSNYDLSVVQPVAGRYTDYAIRAQYYNLVGIGRDNF
jgi:hypothetical protein